MRTTTAVLVALALAVGACSDDGDAGSLYVDLGDDASTTTDASAGEVPYALADVEGWVTVEHRDPGPAEHGSGPLPDLAMDWYAAYERTTTSGAATSVERVAVQGLAEEPDRLADRFAGQRYAPGPDVGGRPALVGEPVADTEPVVLLVDTGDGSTVVVLSYELDRDALLAWAEGLRFVSDEEWSAVPSQG